jgi:hypothetical protein
MLETITAATILSCALPKLLDASLGKVGDVLTEGAIAKLKQASAALKQAILKRVKPEQQVALEKSMALAETQPEERDRLEQRLAKAMEADPSFAQELRQLAQPIYQIIHIDEVKGRNVQNVMGGLGVQVNDSNAPNIVGGEGSTFNLNFGKD